MAMTVDPSPFAVPENPVAKESGIKALVKELKEGMLANLSQSDDQIMQLEMEKYEREKNARPLDLDRKEVAEPSKVKPSPFLKKSLNNSPPFLCKLLTNHLTKARGQPCKKGETAKADGCIPAKEEPGNQPRSSQDQNGVEQIEQITDALVGNEQKPTPHEKELAEKPQSYSIKLNALSNAKSADVEFVNAILHQYPFSIPLFHEVPITALDSIKTNGLTSGESAEDTNFFSIGRPSGFVSSSDKLIVKVKIPSTRYFANELSPDMRYHPDNPAADLLKEHHGVYGADVAKSGKISPYNISAIYVVRDGKIAETLKPPFNHLSKIKPSPFLRKSLNGYHTKDATGQYVGKPCSVKPGLNAARDGCMPDSGEPSKAGPSKLIQKTDLKKVGTQSAEPQKRRAVKGKMVAAAREGKGKEARVLLDDGSPAPAHITPAMIPPAWSRVKVSLDPDADVLATGKMKGKDGQWHNKTCYNSKYSADQQAAKFVKVLKGIELMEEMVVQNQKNRKGPDIEEADCVWLMMVQATRPDTGAENKGLEELHGSPVTKDDVVIERKTVGKKVKKEKLSVSLKVGDQLIPMRDDGVKQQLVDRVKRGLPLHDTTYWLKSHGATSLQGRHVVQKEDGVHLQFVGKETVWHDHLVQDEKLAAMLLDRKHKSGDDGKLFDTDYGRTVKYAHTLDGGIFGLKDFRTMRATSRAIEEIKDRPPPTSVEQYAAAVRDVATKVSSLLGNDARMAFNAYISPVVWSGWRASSGVDDADFDAFAKPKKPKKTVPEQAQNDDNKVAGKSSIHRVKSSPFLAYRTKDLGKLDKGPHVSEWRDKPCPQGVSSERTGCVKAEEERGRGKPGQGKPQSKQSADQQARAVEDVVAGLTGGGTGQGVGQEPTTPDEIVNMFDAMDGARITMMLGFSEGQARKRKKKDENATFPDDPEMGSDVVEVKISHPKLSVDAVRYMGVNKLGQKYIRNEFLSVRSEHQKSGIGTKIFASEVEEASKQGFEYIVTMAAGSLQEKEFNGYYTWPRLGYDESFKSLDRYDPDLVERMRGEFPGAESVLDVFEMEGGREFWRENGRTLYNARFDLREGSRSRQVLNAYLEARKSLESKNA